jgi:hypothetical protein
MLRQLIEAPLAWPFIAAVRCLATASGAALPEVAVIDAHLSSRAGVRFVAAAPKRRRRRGQAPVNPAAYDSAIVEQQTVPTREACAHDLANALVWATFPRTKAAVHQRQLAVVRAAAAGAAPGRSWSRSEEGDALAMFDEGGLLVATRRGLGAEVAEALRRGDDVSLASRVARGDALGVVFGHAIVEHLGRPVPEAGAGIAGLAVAFEVDGEPGEVSLGILDALAADHAARSASLRRRQGNGIASVASGVLGTRTS